MSNFKFKISEKKTNDIYFNKKINYLPVLFKHTNTTNETITIKGNIGIFKNINKIIVNHTELQKSEYIYYPKQGDIFIFLKENNSLKNNFLLQSLFFINILCKLNIRDSCNVKNFSLHEYFRGIYLL